jgi:hypothetical protein
VLRIEFREKASPSLFLYIFAERMKGKGGRLGTIITKGRIAIVKVFDPAIDLLRWQRTILI